jgi:transcriptional regulator with XRE-family HTH domain
MEHIGNALQRIRIQRSLTLHDVALIAEKRGIGISAAWLVSVEQQGAEVELDQIKFLAQIYALTPGQLVDSLFSEGSWAIPEKTSLILPEVSSLSGPYRWGVLGKRDHTLSPQIPLGSAVHIDTRETVIPPVSIRRFGAHRPIYFLRHEATFYCGWFELHGRGLSLVPSPLSTAYRRTWKNRNEVEVVGRVIGLIAPRD